MRRMRKVISFRSQPGDPELLTVAAEEAGASRSTFIRDAAMQRAERVLQRDDEGDDDGEE